MPRTKPGWVPSLGRCKARNCGRARFPDLGDRYFGGAGSWTDKDRPAPAAVVREYRAFCAEWLTAKAAGATLKPQGPSWSCGELARAYAASLKDRPGAKAARVAFRAIEALYDRTPASRFDARALDRCRRWHLSNGAAPRSVNCYAARIKSAFRWGARPEQRMVPPSVCVELALVRRLVDEQERPVEPADPRHVEAVRAKAKPVVAAMLGLQILSGMRPGEVRQMRVGDVEKVGPDFWLYKPQLYKSRRSAAVRAKGGRKVWLGPRAIELISPWIEGKAPQEPVFRSRRGKAFSDRGYQSAVQRACERAKVPYFRPQQVRHAALTAVEERFGRDHAAAVGGHQDSATTRIYTWTAQDRLAQEAMKGMG